MKMRMKSAVLALVFSLGGASLAFAHEAAKGPNGGLRVDAGKYHAELVTDGSPKVAVFLTDAEGKPVPAAGFKGNAILVIDGKPQRVALEPTDGSKLTGTAPVAVSAGVKGAVQLTAPDGTTAQAKY